MRVVLVDHRNGRGGNVMGIEAVQVSTIEDFNRALAVGIEIQGLCLLEVLL